MINSRNFSVCVSTLLVGGTSGYPGGGGGGGYFGGGGGGYDTAYHHVGGAGGSGYIRSDVIGGSFVSHATHSADAVATDQPGYVAGIGAGGAPQLQGSHGMAYVACGDRTQTFVYSGQDQTFTM